MTVPQAALTIVAVGLAAATANAPRAQADNDRLNNSVVVNVYTVQWQAGCRTTININPQLRLAAQWHTDDLLNNRALDGHAGSDGSTPQDRANAAGYRGKVSETVAINPALAINNLDVINQWYHDPMSYGVMADCTNTQIGVWSANSMDRSVVVAVYGQPQRPVDTPQRPAEPPDLAAAPSQSDILAIDPSPDYDASDEIEYGINWFPWILRGVYPPPPNPPQ